MSDEVTPADRSRAGGGEPAESAREPDGESAGGADDDAGAEHAAESSDVSGSDPEASDDAGADGDDSADDPESDADGESDAAEDADGGPGDPEAADDTGDEDDEPADSTADADEPEAANEVATDAEPEDDADDETGSSDAEAAAEDATDSPAGDHDDETDEEPAPSEPKQRSPLWAKLMVAFGALLFLFAGSAAVVGKVAADRFNDAIPQTDLLGDNRAGGYEYEEARGRDVDGPLNYLLIGTDQRGGEEAQIERSDTIIVLHIDEDLENAYLISIPRDLRVTIAECGDGEPCEGKINGATYYGGPDPQGAVSNLANTLTDLTGVEFDGAALVGFENFLNLVETLGGVEVCLPETITSIHGDHRTYPEGCAHYDHEETLDIVRQRYQYSDGDYGRQRMQQHVLRQLLAEAASQGYMTNPTKIGTLLDQLGESMVVDLGGIQPVDLALEMRNVNASELATVRLPSEPANIDGISYVLIQPGEQEEQAEALFESIREDELDAWLLDNPDFVNET